MLVQTQKQCAGQNDTLSLISKDSPASSFENEESSKGSTDDQIEQISLNHTASNTESFGLFDQEEEQENTQEEILKFEEQFRKYYVDSSNNSNGNFDTYVTSALKLICQIPTKNFPKAIQKIKKRLVLPPKQEKTKKTLILDLDETLIHSDLDGILKDHDATLSFNSDDEDDGKSEVIPIPLIIRPGMKKFLDFAAEHFELFVFTASHKNYADAIIDYIEKDKKYFSMRLYREDCLFVHPGLYIKDLSIFEGERSIKDIVLIDNSLFSFSNQLSNGILITSFYDDKSDILLDSLEVYLKTCILNCNDVREVNRENFRFEEYKKDIEEKTDE